MHRNHQAGGTTVASLPGSLLGGMTGIVAALLFAPRSGEETQGKVREKVEALKQRTNEAVMEGCRAMEGQVAHGRHALADWPSPGSALLDTGTKELRH